MKIRGNLKQRSGKYNNSIAKFERKEARKEPEGRQKSDNEP